MKHYKLLISNLRHRNEESVEGASLSKLKPYQPSETMTVIIHICKQLLWHLLVYSTHFISQFSHSFIQVLARRTCHKPNIAWGMKLLLCWTANGAYYGPVLY